MYHLVLAALLPLLAFAQDGSISGPMSSKDAAGYSCDASKCKLPNCNCASTSPPGGLTPSDVPQFIVFDASDAVQSYTIDSVNQFLAQRKNPNGCPPKMTYFTSLNFTDYSLVTDWYVAGNEIADHTMTHITNPSAAEINGNLLALNALAGIPLTAISGFRAPQLALSNDTLHTLQQSQFTYDSSAVASIPVTDPNTDAFWPYTLDNGMANNCLKVSNICKGEPKLPGFWEIPMYAFFDELGGGGPHLMDPWLDSANGASTPNDTATLIYMQKTFMDHYNGNRQPIGLYTHPIHLSKTYPGVNPSSSTISMVNAFLDWAQEQQGVWIVSNAQLLAWVQNPVPLSQLDSFSPLKCSTPVVDSSVKLCNGIPKNEAGLKDSCSISGSTFSTCYGCPEELPTPQNPNPSQQLIVDGQNQTERFRLPSNCTTAFWDPIKGNCICTSSTCQFTDNSATIVANSANLTGGELGSSFSGVPGSSATAKYVPFNSAASSPSGSLTALLFGCVGALLGAASIMVKL